VTHNEPQTTLTKRQAGATERTRLFEGPVYLFSRTELVAFSNLAQKSANLASNFFATKNGAWGRCLLLKPLLQME
jgi:hypothetical protein